MRASGARRAPPCRAAALPPRNGTKGSNDTHPHTHTPMHTQRHKGTHSGPRPGVGNTQWFCVRVGERDECTEINARSPQPAVALILYISGCYRPHAVLTVPGTALILYKNS
jgi:hypothetical protein